MSLSKLCPPDTEEKKLPDTSRSGGGGARGEKKKPTSELAESLASIGGLRPIVRPEKSEWRKEPVVKRGEDLLA